MEDFKLFTIFNDPGPSLKAHVPHQGDVLDYLVESLMSEDLLREATRTWSHGPDVVLKSVTRFGLGFQLYDEAAPIGVRPGCFGHSGAGGSMAFHDPDRRVSFCFAMNQMQEGVVTGGTSAQLVARALYECL